MGACVVERKRKEGKKKGRENEGQLACIHAPRETNTHLCFPHHKPQRSAYTHFIDSHSLEHSRSLTHSLTASIMPLALPLRGANAAVKVGRASLASSISNLSESSVMPACHKSSLH